MKVKKLIAFLAAVLLANVAIPMGASAESLDELKQKEAKATSASETLNSDINTALNDVNEKYAEIEKLKTDIADAEGTIKSSENEIKTTEKSIERRKDVVGDRMKNIQLNGEQRTWQALLEAENLSDFFTRAYAMTVLQNAEREKIDRLTKDKERLAELQETVKTKQSELQVNESKLQQEAVAMDEQVVSLKQQLADNQTALQQIAGEKQSEEKRVADEQKAATARKQSEAEAAKKAAEASSDTSSSSDEKNSSSSTSSETSGTIDSTDSTETSNNGSGNTGGSASNGQVLYMQSTAYSWTEAGSGYTTATGIDLRTQSNVIAVDPSVIPLGSFVEVEGYGYAVAGDTGGAIKGNIIDVHFPTVEQCRMWGRKNNVKVVIQ